jgi:hypothetical protein
MRLFQVISSLQNVNWLSTRSAINWLAEGKYTDEETTRGTGAPGCCNGDVGISNIATDTVGCRAGFTVVGAPGQSKCGHPHQ